ncbi:hypothetical protein KC460_00215 [Candidatus Dependentiae bacterium]|nr:hypothetical protein [Candidatus Dependentiae bacterium]
MQAFSHVYLDRPYGIYPNLTAISRFFSESKPLSRQSFEFYSSRKIDGFADNVFSRRFISGIFAPENATAIGIPLASVSIHHRFVPIFLLSTGLFLAKQRKNMDPYLNQYYKKDLQKRKVIETVFGYLKTRVSLLFPSLFLLIF